MPENCDRSSQQVAEGPRAGVAFRHRASRQASSRPSPRCRKPARFCAPTRSRCSNGCVKAISAPGSPHWRPRQPQLAGARARHTRRRLRIGHQRCHVAKRSLDADPGRPIDGVQHQDFQGSGRSRSLSGQFETHGNALVEAAAQVEQSNRSTTSSVEERKSMLESLVTTIDLRTADLDQRLSRFPDCSMNCSPLPKSAHAISRGWWRKRPAPDRSRSAVSSRPSRFC